MNSWAAAIGILVAVLNFINMYFAMMMSLKVSQLREEIARARGEDREKLQGWVEERFMRKPEPGILQPNSRTH